MMDGQRLGEGLDPLEAHVVGAAISRLELILRASGASR
jgi:hypothetical protein